jgi:pimeloyl-ACP methyl ester carboxylesterase
MYPAAGQLALAGLTPGASVVRFPGAGHALHVEAPARFVGALDRALSG